MDVRQGLRSRRFALAMAYLTEDMRRVPCRPVRGRCQGLSAMEKTKSIISFAGAHGP